MFCFQKKNHARKFISACFQKSNILEGVTTLVCFFVICNVVVPLGPIATLIAVVVGSIHRSSRFVAWRCGCDRLRRPRHSRIKRIGKCCFRFDLIFIAGSIRLFHFDRFAWKWIECWDRHITVVIGQARFFGVDDYCLDQRRTLILILKACFGLKNNSATSLWWTIAWSATLDGRRLTKWQRLPWHLPLLHAENKQRLKKSLTWSWTKWTY